MYSFSWPAGEYAEHTVRQGKATGALGTAIWLGSFQGQEPREGRRLVLGTAICLGKGQEPQATGALGTAMCLGSFQGQEPSEVFRSACQLAAGFGGASSPVGSDAR